MAALVAACLLGPLWTYVGHSTAGTGREAAASGPLQIGPFLHAMVALAPDRELDVPRRRAQPPGLSFSLPSGHAAGGRAPRPGGAAPGPGGPAEAPWPGGSAALARWRIAHATATAAT